MITYPKINSIYKRDERGRFVDGDWALPEFDYLKDCTWVFTEKVDGTNIRLGWMPEIENPLPHWLGGRTENAQIPPHLLGVLMDLWDEIPWAETFPELNFPNDEVVLFGEGYGAKIQKGGGNYISDGCSFILFDVCVYVGGQYWWLKRDAVEDVAAKLGLDVVPIVFEGSIGDALSIVKHGFHSQWEKVTPEGLVGKPKVDLFNRQGKRIITKIKGKDFK